MRHKSFKFIILSTFVLMLAFCVACTRAQQPLGSAGVDLKHWKLQFRGPTDVASAMLVKGFSNQYFHFDPTSKLLTFQVDASESGSTQHSHFVRSELREQMQEGTDAKNWSVQSGTHVLYARLKLAATTLDPDKVTVLQIHGYPNTAPPLMRITFENGDLYVHCKSDNTGVNETKTLLGKYSGFIDLEVRVENKHLFINVNGEQKADKNVDFWNWDNYFKAGAYPQAHLGSVTVQFTKLSVVHK